MELPICYTNNVCIVQAHPEIGFFTTYDSEEKLTISFRIDCKTGMVTMAVPGRNVEPMTRPASTGIAHDMYIWTCNK